MATKPINDAAPDHNSLGKASFIVGILAMILSFIPIIGFVSWLLAPLALLFGFIALRKPSRSLAIGGIITGGIALFVCFSWIQGTKAVGEAMSSDTFNTTGEATDLSQAPVLDASINEVWADIESNKVAAGQKYGKQRLRFTDERIEDFGGDVANPSMSFIGKSEDYISHLVSASFSEPDGKAIAMLKKGSKTSFVCEKITESFGGGYSLSQCKLEK